MWCCLYLICRTYAVTCVFLLQPITPPLAAFSQTTLSSAFSWMKMLEFRLKFHWSLFIRVQLTISQHGSGNGLASSRRQAITWTNDDSSPLDKNLPLWQTTFSNEFSWMKMVEFKFKFHWNLFPGVQLTISQHGSGNGLALSRREAITWTNDDPVHRHIYTALGEDVFKYQPGQGKMATILQTTFSYSFPWKKIVQCIFMYFDSDFIKICFEGSS